MDPLSALKDEHSSVLQELYALDRQLGWLESSGPMMARKILVRLLSGGEKLASDLSLHFQREEKALYPILEKRMGEKAEPVAIMKQEHERLSNCLNKFTSEVARMLKEHDNVRTWELSSSLQDLRSELSDHVSREERVLFWLAEIHLSRSDRNKVSSELVQMRSQAADLALSPSSQSSTRF
jgi:iron-sulfur cluster repair protein YtfE (RIC family)